MLSDRRHAEKVNSIIDEIDLNLKTALENGGGRKDKIYIAVSMAAADVMRTCPGVAEDVLAAYRDTGELIVFQISEYQFEFYVKDSRAGNQAEAAMRFARVV